jgi:hypothetical protein
MSLSGVRGVGVSAGGVCGGGLMLIGGAKDLFFWARREVWRCRLVLVVEVKSRELEVVGEL